MKIKITPLDIRQKGFERALRGYDREEVSAFLLTMSREWENMQDEMKELRAKLSAREREVAKLREVEDSLYKTLKTAEHTGANVVEQARKEAELHLKEARMKAESLVKEANLKATQKVEEAQRQAKKIRDETEQQLKALAQRYKHVEALRKEIIAALQHTAEDTLERTERLKTREANQFDIDQYMANVNVSASQRGKPADTDIAHADDTSATESDPLREKKTDTDQSFFDAIH